MDETNAFFTHSVVGAPFSVVLGRRGAAQGAAARGLQVDLQTGRVRHGEPWSDLFLLGRVTDDRGKPRRRPGPVLRWIERYAFWIAGTGLLAIVGATILLSVGSPLWR